MLLIQGIKPMMDSESHLFFMTIVMGRAYHLLVGIMPDDEYESSTGSPEEFSLVSVHPQLIAGSEKRCNRASAAVATTNRRHVFSDQGRPSFKVRYAFNVRYAHKEKRGKDEMMNAKRLLVYMFDVRRVSVELSYG
ncbi:unnamed protein product [Cuscuta campestris]|uniref:Uncharacterized protein n=1 Tax=Cuscuta campestris TaxID=132261 RepID=A0A484KK25_9ASTE|nr:unnamed protein product [Cuscuta campestris]